MFGLIWKALRVGSILDWLAVGAIALSVVGGAYGLGYVHGLRNGVVTVTKVTAAAPAAAAKAQAKADDRDRERGKSAGVAKDARDKASDTKLNAVLAKLDALSLKACVVPQVAIDLLNEAGQ